jgi:hypothetical protein
MPRGIPGKKAHTVGQESARIHSRRNYLVKHGKASWVIRRYSVEEACRIAGITGLP